VAAIKNFETQVPQKKIREGVLFLLDDSLFIPYKSGIAMAAMKDCSFKLTKHLSHSPDLAPSDFHPIHFQN
jgi:hypothetical protein